MNRTDEKHDTTSGDADTGATAWLGVQVGVLVHDNGPEVMVLDHQDDGDAPEVMPSTSLPGVSLDDHEAAQAAAEDALQVAGWEIVGAWDAVDTGYTVRVRRSCTDA